jgi:hypothetical protein
MRRLFVNSSCALVLALAPAALFAQDPPPQQPPPEQQPQQQQPPPTAFASDAGLIFNQIKPDQTAAFEEAMAKIKEALQKSTDPVRKQQAAGWKVYKAAEPMGQNVLYVFYMDPAVKGADYEMFKILQEGLGDQMAREIFKTLAAAYAAGQNIINMTPIQNFGGGMN